MDGQWGLISLPKPADGSTGKYDIYLLDDRNLICDLFLFLKVMFILSILKCGTNACVLKIITIEAFAFVTTLTLYNILQMYITWLSHDCYMLQMYITWLLHDCYMLQMYIPVNGRTWAVCEITPKTLDVGQYRQLSEYNKTDPPAVVQQHAEMPRRFILLTTQVNFAVQQ